ncbi:MAG: alpha/beta fold hydrolase [Terriglobia bacterium]
MNYFTRVIAAIRYPESTFGKTLIKGLPIILFVLLLALGLSGFAVYRALVPERLVETIDPSSFLLRNFQSISFDTPEKISMEGWFIPSVRGAPVIFLCHGYKSNRSELLTLASTFQENGYNLFLFNFRGHGSSTVSLSTLGIKETQDLNAAINTVTERKDVDPNRVGVWGVTLGAYVALSAAVINEKIKVVVADSPFESPETFLDLQTASVLGVNNTVLNGTARGFFWLTTLGISRPKESLLLSLAVTKRCEKLFITAEETPKLETQALTLFNHSPDPKELLRMKRSRTSILYDVERKNYENTVVDFFKKRLPIRARS